MTIHNWQSRKILLLRPSLASRKYMRLWSFVDGREIQFHNRTLLNHKQTLHTRPTHGILHPIDSCRFTKTAPTYPHWTTAKLQVDPCRTLARIKWAKKFSGYSLLRVNIILKPSKILRKFSILACFQWKITIKTDI